MAIAIDIGYQDLIGANPIFPDGLFVPGTAGVAVVVEEVDTAFRAPDGDGNLDMAVAVDIGGKSLEGVGERCTNGVVGLEIAGVAGVFISNNAAASGILAAGHCDVKLTIAGEVDGIAVRGTRGVGVDDMPEPGGTELVGVFIPSDEGDVGAGGENVGTAITGEVGAADGAGFSHFVV